MIPIIINNRDHLNYTRNLAEQAACLPDSQIVIVDNASTYPPLLKWYDSCPYIVERLEDNVGFLAPWKSGVVNKYAEDFYVVTDSDLDISGVPEDTLQFLADSLVKHGMLRCGLSLRLDDLPDNDLTRKVISHESGFWSVPLGGGIFCAATDTTFAMYSRSRHDPGLGVDWWSVGDSLRTAPPYTCRHLPWYLTSENVTDEDVYYMKHADLKVAIWSNSILNLLK